MAVTADKISADPIAEIREARELEKPSPLEDRDWVLANEAALIDTVAGLTSTIVYDTMLYPRIKVAGKPLPIRYRGLDSEERKECTRAARLPTGRRLPGTGPEIKVDEELSYRLTILEATHPDDRRALWDNQRLWAAVKPNPVYTPDDFIRVFLNDGEVIQTYAHILSLGGFTAEATEIAKSLS